MMNEYQVSPAHRFLLASTRPRAGPTTIPPTAISVRCLMAAYRTPPFFFGCSTWSTTAAPSAADAILVPFLVQGMGSAPTLTAATEPACNATFRASSQLMFCSLSRGLGPACADFGLACRLLWDSPRDGRGRARDVVVYEEPARVVRGRRMELR